MKKIIIKPSHIFLFAFFAALGTFIAGCQPSDDSADQSSAKAIDKQLDEAQADAVDATKELSDFTYAEKQEFVSRFEAQLEEMENNLDEISARIERASASVREEAAPKMAALRAQRDVLEEQIEEIKDAEASTWDQVKTSTGKAYDDLKTSFNDMREWLGEKMTP